MTSPIFEFPQNVAPTFECPALAFPEEVPVIRFPGGIQFQPQFDPSQGVPTNCSMVFDSLRQLQPAFAAFQPFLTLLDTVTQFVQCFFLAVEAIGNPFKVGDLLACLPNLITKVNTLLSLVPALPQGIAAYITLIVDVIRMIALWLGCIIEIFTGIQRQLTLLNTLVNQVNETDNIQFRATLQSQIQCGQQIAQSNTDTAINALNVVARLFCSVRGILLLIPGAQSFARSLALPNASNLGGLNDAIEVLQSVRDVLLGLVNTVSALAGPVGVAAPPDLTFECPLDSLTDEDLADLVPTPPVRPVIHRLLDATTLLPLAVTIAPNPVGIPIVTAATSPTDNTLDVVIDGTGFDQNTFVYFGTSRQAARIETRREGEVIDTTRRTGTAYIRVTLDAGVRTRAGVQFIQAVNPGAAQGAFQGLSAEAGVAGDSGSSVSEEFAVFVA